MNRQTDVADSAFALLIVKSHYRLADKPERTLEALRVFFPGDADQVLQQLRRQPVVARQGDAQSVNAMASAMRAQGFDVEVRAPTASAANDAAAAADEATSRRAWNDC
jgi:hypothetical protein